MNAIALTIVHIQIQHEEVGFGATYGLLWAAQPLLLVSGVFFCLVEVGLICTTCILTRE